MSIFSQHSRFFGKRQRALCSLVRSRGFTLIELLVVGAIIIIVTSLFLVRQSSFDSSTVLRSLAYSVALSMRQAQVYGISVSGVGTAQASCPNGSYANGTCYAPAYGLYFTASPNTIYILFADFNNNGRYDTGEDVQAFTLNNAYKVSEICAIKSAQLGSTKHCSGTHDTSGNPISTLSVIFRRPNPDACISTDKDPGVCGPSVPQVFSGGYIQITSAGGTTRSVTVSNTGAIVVQAPNTSP